MLLKRSTALSVLAVLFALGLCSTWSTAAAPAADAPSEQQLPASAQQIHQRILTLDSHVDIPGREYATEKLDPGIDNPKLRCDLVKMARGDVDGVFLVVYVGQGKRDTEGYRNALSAAMAKFDAIHWLVEQMHPDRCELATSPDDVERIARSGKRAIMIGVENGYPIGTDLGNLDKFYQLGARYMTLSHDGHNQICDSCNPRPALGDGQSEHGGLSRFGEQVVARMNRLGMMVDVSHVAPESFSDVVEASKAPFIASHSGCRALNDHPRSLDDSQLEALAHAGGVIQLVAYGGFLKSASPERRKAIRELADKIGVPLKRGHADFSGATGQQQEQFEEGMDQIDKLHPAATIKDYVDHIDHAVRVAGIDHVGIGSDFDGGGGIPGFNDHSQAPNVTVELVRRGYSEDQIAKIWGGNLLRVWRAVERVAGELRENEQQ